MNGGPITIATQNTRSLGQGYTGRRKRKEIKSLFRQTTPTTDILLLQETKIPEAVCLKQARFIEFQGGSSLWNEGAFSAQTGKFKGGTGIVLASNMASIVTHHGILYPGRAQFVVLNINTRLQLGVVNVASMVLVTRAQELCCGSILHTLPYLKQHGYSLGTSTTLRACQINRVDLPRLVLATENWRHGTNC